MKKFQLACLFAVSLFCFAQASAQFDPNYKGYYLLRTQGAGQSASLESNGPDSKTMNGAAFMSPQKNATGQQWMLVPAEGQPGYCRLKTKLHGDKLCLEGNEMGGKEKGGVAFMKPCQNVSGQMWKIEDAGNGSYRLKTMFKKDAFSLEGNGMKGQFGGNSFMSPTANVSGQFWIFEKVQ